MHVGQCMRINFTSERRHYRDYELSWEEKGDNQARK